MISQTDIDAFVTDLTARLHASEAENARLAAEVDHLRKALGSRKSDAKRWREKAQRAETTACSICRMRDEIERIESRVRAESSEAGGSFILEESDRMVITIYTKMTDRQRRGLITMLCEIDGVSSSDARILSAIQKEGEA